MNASSAITMNYEQLTMNYANKNKPNSKPIKPNQTQYKPNTLDAQMNVSSVITKDYENEPRLRTPGKQTQTNPIFTKNPEKLARLVRIFTQFPTNQLSFFACDQPNLTLLKVFKIPHIHNLERKNS